MTEPLAAIGAEFRHLKQLAERALSQVSDDGFFLTLDDDANSIAILVKHLAGNMRSRFTDFLTTDGEKPNRNRDGEFVIGPEDSREALMDRWEQGWRCVFDAVASLDPEDLAGTVFIRGEPNGVVQALLRQLRHYAYHVGQMVLLARHSSAAWESLSIPRGQSDQYTAALRRRNQRDS